VEGRAEQEPGWLLPGEYPPPRGRDLPSNAWAVGLYSTGTVNQTLIEHWNGAAWKVVKSPDVGTTHSNVLAGVAATSSSNAWAVGVHYPGTVGQTPVEHWNGKSWTRVSSPNLGSDGSALNGVAASSSTNVWAVGSYLSSPTSSETLAIRCC
jgi:hypothetical protein